MTKPNDATITSGPVERLWEHVEKLTAEARAAGFAEAKSLLAQSRDVIIDLAKTHEGKPCWCELPYMIPYRDHDSACDAARAAIAALEEALK